MLATTADWDASMVPPSAVAFASWMIVVTASAPTASASPVDTCASPTALPDPPPAPPSAGSAHPPASRRAFSSWYNAVSAASWSPVKSRPPTPVALLNPVLEMAPPTLNTTPFCVITMKAPSVAWAWTVCVMSVLDATPTAVAPPVSTDAVPAAPMPPPPMP